MLELFARHGAFDLTIAATGDLDVDQHHTVEDLGIALGEAVSQALGDRRGINRAGYFVMPMDETLAVAAIDLGGRPHVVVDLKLKVKRVGDLQAEVLGHAAEHVGSQAAHGVAERGVVAIAPSLGEHVVSGHRLPAGAPGMVTV